MTSIVGRLLLVITLIALMSGRANAVPIMLEYSGEVSLTNISGVNVGDPIIFKVFADNGGSGLTSQTWLVTDIASASFTAGGYAAAFSGPVDSFISFGSFATDASGQLNHLRFGAWGDGLDTTGSTLLSLFMDNGNPLWAPLGVGSIHGVSPANIGNVTISFVSETPIPAALSLFASASARVSMVFCS